MSAATEKSNVLNRLEAACQPPVAAIVCGSATALLNCILYAVFANVSVACNVVTPEYAQVWIERDVATMVPFNACGSSAMLSINGEKELDGINDVTNESNSGLLPERSHSPAMGENGLKRTMRPMGAMYGYSPCRPKATINSISLGSHTMSHVRVYSGGGKNVRLAIS